MELVVKQVVAVGAVGVYSFVVTMGLLLALKAMGGIRANAEQEDAGLDETMHGEAGYNLY